MNKGLQYCNGSFSTRKCQSIVITCGEKLGVEWATGVLIMNENFDPNTVWHKTTVYDSYIGQHEDAEFIKSIALNVKLWPRFQIHKWPGYQVRTMYHIMGICGFPECGQMCQVADFTGVLCLKFEWCLKWYQLDLKVDEQLWISLKSCIIVS
jgi:hypothetical protein